MGPIPTGASGPVGFPNLATPSTRNRLDGDALLHAAPITAHVLGLAVALVAPILQRYVDGDAHAADSAT